MDDYRLQSRSEGSVSPTESFAPGGDREVARSQFTIGEIAREYGFTLRALRFYEEKGLISPRRVGNRRLYSPRDRHRLEIVAQGKRIGLSLDDIRAILRAGDNGESTNDQRMLEVALEKALERVDTINAEREQLHHSLQEAQSMIADLKGRLGRAA